MTRAAKLGTFFICGAHNLGVQAGAGVSPLDHVGGNAGKPCGCQLYTRTERRQVTRAEVLAELAALAGEDGEP